MGKKFELVMLFYLARLFARSRRGHRINSSLILALSGRYPSALPEAERACLGSYGADWRRPKPGHGARALDGGGADGLRL